MGVAVDAPEAVHCDRRIKGHGVAGGAWLTVRAQLARASGCVTNRYRRRMESVPCVDPIASMRCCAMAR